MRKVRRRAIGAALLLAALCAVFAASSLVRAKSAAERFGPSLESAHLVGVQLSNCGSVAQPVTSIGCDRLTPVWVLEYQGDFGRPPCGPYPRLQQPASQCPPNHKERVYVELLRAKVLFASLTSS